MGKSSYYYENYEDNRCSEIKTKKEPLDNIADDYLDGSCTKSPWSEERYVKLYCIDDGIL